MLTFLRLGLLATLALSLLSPPPVGLSGNDLCEDNEEMAELVRAVDLHLTTDDFFFAEFDRNKGTIISHPKPAGDLLMRRLSNAKDSVQVGRAAMLLIELGHNSDEIRTALVHVLSRAQAGPEDRQQRNILLAAMEALQRIGTSEDADTLLPLLKHSDPMVQIKAVRALGAIADAKDVQAIERILEQHARNLSAEALQQELKDERKQHSLLYEGFQALGRIKYRSLVVKELEKKGNE